jgi:hypothetical protein
VNLSKNIFFATTLLRHVAFVRSLHDILLVGAFSIVPILPASVPTVTSVPNFQHQPLRPN